MKKIISGLLLSLTCIFMQIPAWAQRLDKSMFNVDAEPVSEVSILVKSIYNGSPVPVKIAFSGKERDAVELASGERRNFGKQCRIVRVIYGKGESFTLWSRQDTQRAWKSKHGDQGVASEARVPETPVLPVQSEAVTVSPKTASVYTETPSSEIGTDAILGAFADNVEYDPYFSRRAIDRNSKLVEKHVECLHNWSDKQDYIQAYDLEAYLTAAEDSLVRYRERIPAMVADFIAFYTDKGYTITDQDLCGAEMRRILESRLAERGNSITLLRDAMRAPAASDVAGREWLGSMPWLNVGVIVFLLVGLFLWFMATKRKRKQSTRPQAVAHASESTAAPTIIVRRKTTSILKKQSLEDVIDNKAYMKIECADFCNDSAVRRIYLKNTCIKEIYNLYAEDLRNPDNPKEDGCMVLGRWVYDNETNEYYVSLEHIVKPGDDAVFQEYELNFGGKIKLKVAEKLRKLRRETNLQYDLTCWVHSHPGLGVFFSNSDNNVQLQLKHPTHPNFLTAIVIDILTPEQELGIFTFRHDSTVNSKNDLKKLYSLEAWHKWAVESDKYSFRPEDHYNLMGNTENRLPGCAGVELSNGAIIDMCSIVTDSASGLAGRICGYACQNLGRTEYVVNAISRDSTTADGEMLGCFVVGTYCSLPSIRKAISHYADTAKFVLCYSISDDTVTAIPLENRQLSMNEKCYGEEKLTNLKIWTRRRR